MKLQFGIQPEKTKSNIESFEGYTNFHFIPFDSNITDLCLFLKSIYGIVAQIPIIDTQKPFSIPIKSYEYGWFEYSASDAQYLIDVGVD